jgi:hypothetical protein
VARLSLGLDGRSATDARAAAESIVRTRELAEQRTLQEATRKKQGMLVRERVAAARAAAAPWILALKRSGFTTLRSVARVPAATVAHAIQDAYPIHPAPGLTLEDAKAVTVAAAVPPTKIATLIATVVQDWIDLNPTAAAAIDAALRTYDPRFQRTAPDPHGIRPGPAPTQSLASSIRPIVEQVPFSAALTTTASRHTPPISASSSSSASSPAPASSASSSSAWRGSDAEAVREAVRREHEVAWQQATGPGRSAVTLAAPATFDLDKAREQRIVGARATWEGERDAAKLRRAPSQDRASNAVLDGNRILRNAGAGGIVLRDLGRSPPTI